MIRLSNLLRLTSALLAIVLLAACAPGEVPPSPEDIEATVNAAVALTMEAQGQIATSVAMTVAAQETESARALPTPTLVPPEPLPTATPILPTATPFAITPSSSGGGGGGGGGGSSTAKNACDPDLGKRPFDNSVFRPGDSFDIKFTIMNTGTSTWPAGYDLVYHSGPFMAPAFPALIELPEMEPGDKFAVGPYDATAPADEGFHVMTFKLQGGFCYPYIAIVVK